MKQVDCGAQSTREIDKSLGFTPKRDVCDLFRHSIIARTCEPSWKRRPVARTRKISLQYYATVTIAFKTSSKIYATKNRSAVYWRGLKQEA